MAIPRPGLVHVHRQRNHLRHWGSATVQPHDRPPDAAGAILVLWRHQRRCHFVLPRRCDGDEGAAGRVKDETPEGGGRRNERGASDGKGAGSDEF